MVKARASKPKGRKPTVASKAGRGPGWPFPKNSLEEALAVPRAIELKGAGHPMEAEELARACGFNQATDWRFQDLGRSAHHFGLVSWAGVSKPVQLTAIGTSIVRATSAQERSAALTKAFNAVDLFAKVAAHYADREIVFDEFFFNTLTKKFGIAADKHEKFAEVFVASRKLVDSFAAPNSKEQGDSSNEGAATDPQKTEPTASSAKTVSESRKYLAKCFVVMPFGGYFDTYYKDVYAPAVRDANLEPGRADEIFASGSVIEQIVKAIKAADVVLADLSGKNPNVFYELGLAHAMSKPVVYVSASVDDIPFDVRHLRTIVFNIQQPFWAERLKTDITDYLKNALREPAETIPNPFRPVPL